MAMADDTDPRRRASLVVVPFTVAVLLAQQVASNAIRDGLFLTWFPVTALPYFIAATAMVAAPAAESSGRLLVRFGPRRVVPALLGMNSALFLAEWGLLHNVPRVASGLVYLHVSVLGAIGISALFSLLNERVDPHSAKPLMAQVAAAATLGGLAGGVGAERVTALFSPEVLLGILAALGGTAVAGSVVIGRGMPAQRAQLPASEDQQGGWAEIRRVPLLRALAFVVGLAAALAALLDYLLKSDAAVWFGPGDQLVRFFGLFYAGTALSAFLLQTFFGRLVLARVGLGGSVASHSLLVGASSLLAFVLPAPWRGVIPRGVDVTVRASVFKAGYELFYTPLPESAKRAAKSTVDVTVDCFGKGAGAVLIVLLTTLGPLHTFAAVQVAGVLAAGAEFAVARRLRARYVGALEGGLRRQEDDLQIPVNLSLADFTIAQSMAGLDDASIHRALDQTGEKTVTTYSDAVVAAIADLRSGDLARIRRLLRVPPTDPLLIGALVPLLAKKEILKPVVAALTTFGVRGAGQLVDALLDPTTPEEVRRRLPLVLRTCGSSLARDGLLQALAAPNFELRLRCGRALLELTEAYPALTAPHHVVLEAVDREFALVRAADDRSFREHIFNLLALAFEREPVRMAALAFDSDDDYLRGTALEYLETVLPPRLFSALAPRLSVAVVHAPQKRDETAARAELLHAATIRINRDELRRQLDARDRDADSHPPPRSKR